MTGTPCSNTDIMWYIVITPGSRSGSTLCTTVRISAPNVCQEPGVRNRWGAGSYRTSECLLCRRKGGQPYNEAPVAGAQGGPGRFCDESSGEQVYSIQ